eukprot:6162069-Amphidinium_carterae.4
MLALELLSAVPKLATTSRMRDRSDVSQADTGRHHDPEDLARAQCRAQCQARCHNKQAKAEVD